MRSTDGNPGAARFAANQLLTLVASSRPLCLVYVYLLELTYGLKKLSDDFEVWTQAAVQEHK